MTDSIPNDQLTDRLRGVAVGAAVGDALGMPLEFGPAIHADRLVRTMLPGRLSAGSFTDDTEMALALAESLLARRPLDPEDLARRFVAWGAANPPDIGIQTRTVLSWLEAGLPWHAASARLQQEHPESAGNGSVMRCWPVALRCWNDRARLVEESILQSRVTHPHPDCVAGCVFVNTMIADLVAGKGRWVAFEHALSEVDLPPGLRDRLIAAPGKIRRELANTGWVRHTLESAVWGLLAFDSFEETVVQVANLGSDADTAATVAGALAGAAYGLAAIPPAWKSALWGHWPVNNGTIWRLEQFIALADRLVMAAPG